MQAHGRKQLGVQYKTNSRHAVIVFLQWPSYNGCDQNKNKKSSSPDCSTRIINNIVYVYVPPAGIRQISQGTPLTRSGLKHTPAARCIRNTCVAFVLFRILSLSLSLGLRGDCWRGDCPPSPYGDLAAWLLVVFNIFSLLSFSLTLTFSLFFDMFRSQLLRIAIAFLYATVVREYICSCLQ